MIKGKKIKFELTGNSSYPSSSYRRSTVFSSVYERWFLTAKVKETTIKSIGNARSMLIQSVFVSADSHGEYHSDDQAKHNMCSVFNDISHFRCFLITHELNFEFTS